MGFFAGADAVKPLPSVLETDSEAIVTIRGVEYHIAFDLEQMTPRLRKKLNAIRESGSDEGGEDSLIEYVCTILTGWDFTDKAGIVLPITIEGVSWLTYTALNAIADAISGSVPNAPGEAVTEKVASPS